MVALEQLQAAINSGRASCCLGIKSAEELGLNTSGWWERLRHLETLEQMLEWADEWRPFSAPTTVDELVAHALQQMGLLSVLSSE